MRAFIGLELPRELADAVAATSREFSSMLHGRFVPAENYHLTLAFLGEVDSASVEAAKAALDRACAGRGPIALAPAGFGTFGRPIDATLWLGVVDSVDLIDLARSLRDELDRAGVPYDDKPFAPHVTLARRARILRDALPPFEGPCTASARRATLYESVLSPDGAAYRPVYSVDFGA